MAMSPAVSGAENRIEVRWWARPRPHTTPQGRGAAPCVALARDTGESPGQRQECERRAARPRQAPDVDLGGGGLAKHRGMKGEQRQRDSSRQAARGGGTARIAIASVASAWRK